MPSVFPSLGSVGSASSGLPPQRLLRPTAVCGGVAVACGLMELPHPLPLPGLSPASRRERESCFRWVGGRCLKDNYRGDPRSATGALPPSGGGQRERGAAILSAVKLFSLTPPAVCASPRCCYSAGCRSQTTDAADGAGTPPQDWFSSFASWS